MSEVTNGTQMLQPAQVSPGLYESGSLAWCVITEAVSAPGMLNDRASRGFVGLSHNLYLQQAKEKKGADAHQLAEVLSGNRFVPEQDARSLGQLETLLKLQLDGEPARHLAEAVKCIQNGLFESRIHLLGMMAARCAASDGEFWVATQNPLAKQAGEMGTRRARHENAASFFQLVGLVRPERSVLVPVERSLRAKSFGAFRAVAAVVRDETGGYTKMKVGGDNLYVRSKHSE